MNKFNKKVILIMGVIIIGVILLYYFKVLQWEKWRGLELIISSLSLLSLGFLVYEFWRNRLSDMNAISISPCDSDGVFLLRNSGILPLNVKLEKAILNKGCTEEKGECNPSKGSYITVFTGVITPKQEIAFHAFDITRESIYVFKGVFRLKVDQKILYIKVRYAGKKVADSSMLRYSTHPHYKWVIYEQNISSS